MATEYKQRTAQGVDREYPTEWAWYPQDVDANAGQEEQLQVSKVESATTADKPKYLTQAA
jgi:hypothetical protein